MGELDAGGAGPAPVLETLGVRKTYGERVVTEVLKGIDLRLDPGELCALTGPSGSGKTTLLNLVGLLDRPTTGRIRLAGTDTTDLDDDERTRIRGTQLGFVFQFHHLLPAFTALENVMLPLLAQRRGRTSIIREQAARLLDEVGLADRAGYRSTDLSGGQAQRVAIARALVTEPTLVLADEPTGNLDSETTAQVMDLLESLNRRLGTAFLIVTHEEAVSARCRRTIHMVDGRIAWDRRSSDGGERPPPPPLPAVSAT